MKQNRSESLNMKPFRPSVVPRYSHKYQHILERIQSSQIPPPKKKQLFFYRVKSIGVGAFSFVYMVKEEGSGTVYAQKSIARKNVSEELFSQVKLHLFLSHPNIVRLYHVYSDNDFVYLIMEYAQDSLFALRKNKKIPQKMDEQSVAKILKQILNAVQYLHSNTIIHADLKLENILISQNVVKICDFGLSTKFTENKQNDVKGTLEYLPPEYVRGVNSFYKRDIWAIGIIAYELLTGTNPLQSYSENQKWTKMLTVKHILRQMEEIDVEHLQISTEMREFLRKSLCKAEERATCAELLEMEILREREEEVVIEF